MALAITTVDLARLQFATTSLYHFLFVPLTLGLAPLVAVMQTLWYRGGDERWLRLARFFGTLMLINFAIGVATGLVQEFQFGMNWSIYSEFVGDVFGAPLAIEGLAAFMLESTFLGLWIFGWDRLSKRVHLATIWIFALGSWLSAFFIIVANSWMQRPVGSTIADGRAELTDVWALMSNRLGIVAYTHVILVGLTTACVVVFGIACWHLVRGRNQELFLPAAKLALIVGVPVSALNLAIGSHLGVVITDYQPMKIAATEALWETEQPASFSVFQIGGFSVDDQTPSLRHRDPRPPLDPRDRLAERRGAGAEPAPGRVRGGVRGGELHPAGQDDVLEHADHGLRRVARLLRPCGGRVLLPAPHARDEAVAAVGRRRDDPAAVCRGAGGLGAHRGRPAAVDRVRPAEDGGRQLAECLHDDDRVQPRHVRAALRRARGRRRDPHASLRARRSARDRRRRRRVRDSRGELLMDLESFWFVLIAVLWAGYFVLEGFDFGVGMLLPFVPRSDEERGTLLKTIGPVWDGNEVWLVVAGGATFAAFPAWYATMFSGFYVALLLILVFLIVRVCSFEWRTKSESPRWRNAWSWANTICSFGAPLVWGIALANLVGGTPIDSDGDFAGSLADLFSPYTVAAGVAVVLLFAFHGATFLTLRTTGELAARAEHAARRLAIPAAVWLLLQSRGRWPSRWIATTRTCSHPPFPPRSGSRRSRSLWCSCSRGGTDAPSG